MKRPIMLWITSRSRSSMVSKIFVEHGVWWGDTFAQTAGYEMYENQNIKKLQNKYKEQWGRPFMRPIEAPPEVFENFQTELAKLVTSDKKWMMKTGVEYFNAYESLNPYNIFIYRPPEDVAKSLCKKTNADYDVALNAAVWRYQYMTKIEEEFGGKWISTDSIIEYDEYSQVQDALEYCGIEYSAEATKSAITRK